MKKILAFLYLCLAFALGTAQAQNLNAPARVCLSPNAIDKRWATVSVGNPDGDYTQWNITIGGVAAVAGVDYNILYGTTAISQGCNNCATASPDNRSLVIEFLKAGTYTVRARQRNSTTGTVRVDLSKNIVVESCVIATCKGQNSNMAGFTEDFGTTTKRIALDPSRGQIEYIENLTAGSDLQDNQYAISNQMQLKPDWDTSLDHTGNTNGAMLVANSSIDKKSFYLRGVGRMCPGAVYNFTAWFRNANSQDVIENICEGGYIYAGVTFEILNGRNTSQILASYNTNDVSMPLQANPPNRGWQQYGGSFQTPPGIDTVVVRIKNNNPGGCGNDIAVDDIAFTYCAPYIYSFFDGQTDQLGGEYTMCAGAATNLTSIINPAGYFSNPQYFWQYSRDTTVGWTTIGGDADGITGSATDVLHFAEDALLLQGKPSTIDSIFFRLQVYERGNTTSCAQPSVPIKVILLPNPKITVAGAEICLGESATLTACCGYDSYAWTDPAHIGDGDQITVSPTSTTIYTVTGRKDYGMGRVCFRTADAPVVVDDPPVVDLNLTSNNPICIGDAVNLSIDQSSEDNLYDIVWDPTGAGGSTLTHTPTTIGPNTYKVTVTNGACVATESVVVNVIDKPNVTLVPVSTICNTANKFTLAFNTPVNSPNRYDIKAVTPNAMPGFTAVTNATFPASSPITVNIPTGVAPGTYTFNLVLRNTTLNACETTKSFTVTIEAPSAPPTGITASVSQICVSGSVTLTVTGGTLGTGANWVWYSGSCGGTLLGTGPSIIRTVNTTTTFYVRAEGAGPCGNSTCLSTVVTVSAMPNNAVAGGDQAHCENPTFIMAGNQPSPATAQGTWTVISSSAPLTSIVIANKNQYNTTVTVPNGDTAVLAWQIQNGSCFSTADQVILRNFRKPSQADAGSNQDGCEEPSFTLNATAPAVGTGVWSVVSGTPTIANPTLRNTTVTVPIGTSAVLRWTVSNGNPTCTSTTDDILIVNYRNPSTANAGADKSDCNVTFFDMTATAPTVGTGLWTIVSGTATIVTPTSPTTRVTLTPGSTVVLRWTVSNGNPCTPSTDDVTLISYITPTTAAAGADQAHCNISTFTMAANAPAAGAGTGSWSVVSGTATITTLTAPNTTVAVPAGNTAVLRWTISNGGTVCTPSTDDVTLVNYEMPTTANAGGDKSACNVTFFDMTANVPTVGTGSWTLVSGTATIVTPTSPTTRVNITPGNTAVLRWTITNGSPTCTPSTDDVTLVSFMMPTTAAAGIDQAHCNNSTFTMAANAPAAGAGTGRWSIVSGTATIADPANRNTTVTVIAGNTAVLRWTISNGNGTVNCTPSTDDVTLINYNEPSQADAGSNQDGCEEPSFTLNATAPAVGTGVWSVVSGTPTIANPTLRNTTVTVPIGTSAVLRWTVSNGNPTCTSTTDDILIVNYRNPSTANAGADKSDCNVTFFDMTATAPTVGTGLWTIVSGTATIVTPTSPTTRVTLTPGSTVVLRWTVSNGNPCTPSTDDVTLISYITPTTAAAGADQAHCNISTFTMAANAPAAGAGTGSWSIVSGAATIANPAAPNTTVTVAAGNTAVLRWTISNGGTVCTPSTDDVTLVNYEMPTTANAGGDKSACNVTFFDMTANVPTVGTGSWTLVSGTATIVTPTSPTTRVTLTPGATAVLRWTITNGSPTCTPSTDDVTLVSFMMPTTAAAGIDQAHCNNSTFTMAANAPAAGAGTGRWSIVSGTATIADPANRNTTVTVTAGNTAVLRWTISNGNGTVNCTPSTDDVTLINYNQPSQAAAGPDQDGCEATSFTLNATAPAVGTGVWSVVSGTPTIANPTLRNTTVTVPIGTSAVLRWTVSNGNPACTSTTDDLLIVNYRNPSTANAGADKSDCNVIFFGMTATAPTVGTGLWTIVSGAATIVDPTSPTTRVNLTPGSTVVLRWTVSNGGPCTPSTDDVTLVSYKTPTTAAAGVDQAHCNISTFTMAANAPAAGAGTGSWSIVSGAATIANPTAPNTTVTVAAGNTAVLRWTISNGGMVCTPSTDDVTLVNYEMPTTANAGGDKSACNVTFFDMTANVPTVGTGLWTLVSGAATIVTPTSPTTRVTLTPGATVVLRWTVTNGSPTCTPSTDDVTLVSFRMPTTATAGPDQAHCNNSTFTMAANAPAAGAGTGRWSIVSGTATIADPANRNTTVTVTAGNTAVLRWTISNGNGAMNCAPSTDDVTLINYNQPSQAIAGPDQAGCELTSFTLNATAPTVGTGVWSIVSGAATIVDPTDRNSTVTIAVGASVVLRWTVSNGSTTCAPTSDDVSIISYRRPSTANAGVDKSACNVTFFDMTATAPTVGTGLWTIVSGAATIVTPTSPTTRVILTPGSTVVLRWTVSNGSPTCTPSTDDVTLISYKMPTTATAGADQTHCNNSTFTMAANAPAAGAGTGSWSIVSGTATIANPAAPNTSVTVAAGNTAVLRWTISNGAACAPSMDDVTLVNYAMPTIANAGIDQKACNMTTFTLAGNQPTVGTGRWSVVLGSAALSISNPALYNTAVTVAVGDSVILRWTITNGSCTASTDDVTLVSYRTPATANAGADQQQCNNTTGFTMNANATGVTGIVGTWTIISGTATITNIHDPKTVVKVAPGVSATLRWSISNGVCMGTTDDVVITNVALVMGNTISADQTVCMNEIPAALTGGTLTGGTGTYTYQWQSSTVSATTGFTNIATATNATYTPGVLAQDTWFRRIVTSGPCANNISNAVKITVVNKPPVVVFVPGPLTVDCEMGKDYTTLFGTPQFSHTPYTNMPLTVTFTDAHFVNGCTQTFTRTWTATDKCGMSTTASQTITVVDKTAPVFTSAKPADVTVDCDKVPAPVTLTAMDNCMGALTVSPVETRQNIPGECANNYKLIRTWTATDGCSNSLTLTQVITVKDMTAPVFSVTPPRDTLVNCDAVPAAIALTATDNCTPGVINVTATDVRQSIPGSQCADNYQIIRTWIAMDACGNKATVKQTITVQDTTRPTFSIPQPANVTVDCDKVPAWPVITANDNCSGNVKVVVGEQKLPTQPACANNYRLIRTWTATDNCGNMNSMQQIITVQDTTRPVFTMRPPADTTVDCGKVPAPPNNVVATDACSGNVKLSRTQVREEIPGATCQSNYRLIRTWIATDECGNQAIWRQVITVQDTTRPVIAPAPADITLTCGQPVPAPATLMATDNCDGSFPKPAAMREDPYVKDVCAGYTIIRRWNIADGCGNQANEVVQRITVMPCPKPELDPALPMNCSDNPNFTLKLRNNVSNPTYTLIGIVPANAVRVPLTQSNPVFNLNNATQASFIVTDGVTGCVSDTVTYNLQYTNKPMVNLGMDTTICGGNSLILDAGAANFAYPIRWSTGETTQRINVSTAGTYWVSVTNGICVATDTIKVDVVPMPLINIPDASICRGQSVKLDAFVDGGNYLWSTGETSSSILVSTQEQFWVKVVKSGCITIDTVNVTVNPPPDFSLNRDTTICPNQSIMLTVNVTNGGTIRWATGATTSSIVVNEPGQYWVTISRDNCMVRDTVNVRLQPSITVDLGPDREICPGSQITIDGTTKDALSYLWSDGDPNPVKLITATGEYRLDVMDRFCQRIFSDSVRVMLAGMPEIDLGRDTVMCIGEVLRLRADGKNITRVLWSDGTTGPFIDINRPGTYSVTVFNDCGSSTDQITVDYKQCDPEPHFPTAFSPNGDGRNDLFRPVVRGPMYEYELRIFNRWGELIYLGRDQKKGWDGRYQGQPVSIGTYVWWLTYKKMPGGNPNVIKGEVTVVK